MPSNSDEVSADIRFQQEAVERFLVAAGRLTDAQWQVVYDRYLAKRRVFDLAHKHFGGASIDSIMRRQRTQTQAEIDERGRQLQETHERVTVLASRVSVTTSPDDGTVPFEVRLCWFLTRVMVILWSLDRVLAVPKRVVAARKFLMLFEGLIEFPEIQ